MYVQIIEVSFPYVRSVMEGMTVDRKGNQIRPFGHKRISRTDMLKISLQITPLAEFNTHSDAYGMTMCLESLHANLC